MPYQPIRLAYEFHQGAATSGRTVLRRRYPAGGTETGATGLRSRGGYVEEPIRVFEDPRSDRRNPDPDGSSNDGRRVIYTTEPLQTTDAPLQRPADLLVFVDRAEARQVWLVTSPSRWDPAVAGYVAEVRFSGSRRGESPFDD